MKKIIPLFLVFVFQFGNAQKPYLPLLTDSIRWENLSIWANSPGPIANYSTTESNIMVNTISHNDTTFRIFNNEKLSGYEIYIYEDTINRKVYGKRNLDDLASNLIYDFSLTEGDTFSPPYWGHEDSLTGAFTCKIEFITRQIEYLEYQGVIRKTIFLEKINSGNGDCSGVSIIPKNITIIEGIGSTFIFDYFDKNSIETVDWEFLCVQRVFKNGIAVLGNLSLTVCDGTSNYDSIDKNKSQIYIYPNPVEEELIINNLPIGKALNLQIFNLIGESVINKSIQTHSNEMVIQLPKLASGVYLFVLRDSNGERLHTEKLVRQ